MRTVIFLIMGFLAMPVFGQDSLNVNKLGHLAYTPTLNDVWGYADGNGNEYALVGARSGFSVVDVTDPANPVEKFFIPGATSTWRDIKTFDHYAYVMHDNYTGSPDGIMIVDLDSVNQPNPKVIYRYPSISDTSAAFTLERAHNLYIDEKGYLYVFGATNSALVGVGGALIFDLNTDPEDPVYVGWYNDYYLHDGMVRGDTLWGGAINNGLLVAVDVSNKSNTTTIGSKITPNAFTHNVWISDDNNTLFTTDEKTSAFVASYDVSDLSNITELDRIQTSLDSNVIPHNTHVYGDFLVTSYYTSGLQIVDASYPNNLIETAYYDTSPLNGDGYLGAWGAYPYLPSGNILITDMQEGLFILSSSYPRGCFLEALVKDSVTSASLVNAQLEFLASDIATEFTDIFGEAFTGTAFPGLYDVIVSSAGYRTDTFQINLQSGVLLSKSFALLPNDFSIEETVKRDLTISPNPSRDFLRLEWDAPSSRSILRITDLTGSSVLSRDVSGQSAYELGHNLPAGSYLVFLESDGKQGKPAKLVVID